jgi:hypothetical protein
MRQPVAKGGTRFESLKPICLLIIKASPFLASHYGGRPQTRSGVLAMSYKALFALAVIGPLSLLGQPGIAQERPSLHPSWPIQNGFNRQPTQNDLRALHGQDVSPNDARELDRLYDELMSNNYSKTHHPGDIRTR